MSCSRFLLGNANQPIQLGAANMTFVEIRGVISIETVFVQGADMTEIHIPSKQLHQLTELILEVFPFDSDQ